MTMTLPAIECRNLTKIWNAQSHAPLQTLKDVSFCVGRGELNVLLGPSGCGKSTLLYLIAGLDEPSSGQLLCDGEPLQGPSPERGMIFQEAALYPWLNILDNVGFGLSLQGIGKAARNAKAMELLEAVGLQPFWDKKPSELSGGMRQRAAMARALCMNPKVLMMDEPFAALDIQTRSKMQDYLIALWQRSQASILLVTHSIEEAIGLADNILVFTSRPGRIKTQIKVELPRPRNPRDPAFHQLQDHLADLMADEVNRAFAEQESAHF